MASRARDRIRIPAAPAARGAALSALSGALAALLAALLLSSCGGGGTGMLFPFSGSAILSSFEPLGSGAAGGAEGAAAPLIEGGVCRLSRREALEVARRCNRQFLLARAGLDMAEGQAMESRSAALPQLSFTGSYTRLDEVATADIGGVPVELGRLDNYSLALNLSQPLFLGGRMRSAWRSGRIIRKTADEKYRSAAVSLRAQVLGAYDDLLLARRMVEVSGKSLETARRHATDVELKFEEGVASEYEFLRARVRAANVRAESVAAQNAARMAETGFLWLLGLPLDLRELELTDGLEEESVEMGRAEALRIARLSRSDLRAAEFNVRLGEEGVRSARAELLPSLFLGGALTEEQPSRKSFGGGESWEFGWTAGIQLSVPIFDGMRGRGRLRQARSGLEQARLALADLEALVDLEVIQALASLEDAEAMLESQRGNVGDAEKAHHLAETGLKAGTRSRLEVLDAETALDQARRSHYQAVHACRRARIEIERALGGIELPTARPEETPVPVPEVPVLPETETGPEASPEAPG